MKVKQEYLALDLGATSGRACLGGFDGDRLQLHEIHRFPNHPIESKGSLCWDFPLLCLEIESALQKAAAESSYVVSVGCDTWGLDYGFLDPSGVLMQLPYSYQDPRTTGALARIESVLPKEEVYVRTATPCVSISTLCQLLTTRDMAPGFLNRVGTLLFMPNLVHHYLTGEAATEFCIASTSQLTSWQSREWDLELMNCFGLPPRIFPSIQATGSRVGPLRSILAQHLGLPTWEVVLPAGHDTASAVAAAPVSSPSDLIISSGTWSMLGILVDEPVTLPEACQSGCGTYGIPGPGWCFMQGVMGLWLLERFRREEQAGAIEDLVEQATKFSGPCALFDPRAPVFSQTKPFRAGLTEWCHATGQQLPENTGGWVRSILESLALFYERSIRNLARMAERKIERVVIVGGGARNRLLNQLTANATGLPVFVGPTEATVVGNVLSQAVGRGELGAFADIREVVRNSWPVEVYEPSDGNIWEEKRTAVP